VIKPKKHLGQHFLKDENIAQKIVGSLTGNGYDEVLEIGSGTGALTKWLMKDGKWKLHCIETDAEAVSYLKSQHPNLDIIEGDFLKFPLNAIPSAGSWRGAIIGNFPYNISSQILFKVYEHRDQIPEVVGMLQKEVAERISTKPGSKTYGILSVLLQAFYSIEYLFTVSEQVFTPIPKVKSAVIRMRRNDVQQLDCDEILFKKVVKTSFNQRRKMLRNTMKPFISNSTIITQHPDLFSKRPEQLSVSEFIELTHLIQTS